jgi:hypothetical protein
MSFRAIFTCDICKEDTARAGILGCRFQNLHDFKLSPPESTDGTHICNRCLDQLRVQLGPKRVEAKA